MSYTTRRQRALLWFLLALLSALTALILTAPRPDAQFDEYSPDGVTIYEGER